MKRILLSLTLLLVGVEVSYSQSVCFLPSACGTTTFAGGTIAGPLTVTTGPLTLGSGQLLLPDGTTAAPAISFATSPTTGFYQNFAGQISYVTGSTAYWVFSGTTFKPQAADTNDFGTTQIRNLYLARSIQGSKSKALVDNTATAFVRLAVADDDYEHCNVIYTAYAEDTATDARQVRAGDVHVAILNNSGTETAAFSTGDSSVIVTAGTFTCTFDGATASADTIDLRATCDTSLAATTTLTFEWRLDCPSTVTVTPQ